MEKPIKAYLVGGAVRDHLMGIEAKDFDYAVEAPSFQAMVEWIERRGKIFLAEEKYWTVRAHIEGKKPADFVLCRKDGAYSDGRRPDSVEPGTLLDDLSRRDFTVNAMALDEETGEILDPFGGREDLKRKLLRCVGGASYRFEEDPLRMLRALRFAITKDFFLDGHIAQAFNDKSLLQKLELQVSEDRKRDELTKCFKHDSFETMHRLTQDFYSLGQAAFRGTNIWLMPTSKEK